MHDQIFGTLSKIQIPYANKNETDLYIDAVCSCQIPFILKMFFWLFFEITVFSVCSECGIFSTVLVILGTAEDIIVYMRKDTKLNNCFSLFFH